jgi:hypothetical protein
MADKEKQFRISDAKLVSFEIGPDSNGDFDKAVAFELDITLEINPEEGLVLYKTQVRLSERDTEKYLAGIAVDVVYQLDEFDAVVKQKGSEYEVDTKSNHIMTRAAVGITRGLLAAELQKTYLHVFLPLLPIEMY